MELTDLAFAGLDQYCSQYLFINRREAYKSDGMHGMGLRAVGSIGHGCLLSLSIRESLIGNDFGGREWNVELRTMTEAKNAKAVKL